MLKLSQRISVIVYTSDNPRVTFCREPSPRLLIMSSVLRQVLNLTVTDNCCWERVIGGESYCKTYRVKFSPKSVFGVNGPAFDNGGLTILKVIDIKLTATLTDKDIDTVWKSFLADLSILKSLPHPHVLAPINFTTNYERNSLHVKFPIALKNLVFFVNSEKRLILQATKFGRFDFLVRKYMYQIAKALQHLHTNRIMHGRLKLENILIINENEDIVLSDMYYKRNFETQLLKECIYLPPECFHPKGRYIFNSDMYVLGIILIELLAGDRMDKLTLGPICMQPDKLKKLLHTIKVDFPRHFLDMIENLIKERPDQRWSATDLVNHLEEGILRDQEKFAGGFGDVKTKAEAAEEKKQLESEQEMLGLGNDHDLVVGGNNSMHDDKDSPKK